MAQRVRGVFLWGIVGVFLSSCKITTIPTEMQPLLGEWERVKNNGSPSWEIWERRSSILWEGKGCSLSEEGDTVIDEKLRLEILKGKLLYIASVPDQNQGAAISFVYMGKKNAYYSFENKRHDFPQVIGYRFSKDTMRVRLEGEGVASGVSLIFSR